MKYESTREKCAVSFINTAMLNLFDRSIKKNSMKNSKAILHRLQSKSTLLAFLRSKISTSFIFSSSR